MASKIVACGFVENTEFIVIENGVYREAAIFKQEIADKLDELSGLTFFAHTKGVSSILRPDCDTESILKWIFGCYYLSLENIEEVHDQMQVYQPKDQRFFYGSFLRVVLPEEGGGTKYGPEYEGTFYWTNCNVLLDYMREKEIPLPRNFGRFYAERFPGDILSIGTHLGTHKYKYLAGDWDLYKNANNALEFLVGEDELPKFNKLYEEFVK